MTQTPTRRSIVVVEGLYRDPEKVRNYALGLSYYTPYEDGAAVRAKTAQASWWASRFREAKECPFKSSARLIELLERAVDETIDLNHWRASHAVDKDSKPYFDACAGRQSCLWNCSFHVKPDNGQRLGDGVHNHVTDSWNSVGQDGWTGIVYLNPAAPLEGGLHLWRNKNETHKFDWMTKADNWDLVDSFGNVFNRLLLVRGDLPHSGAAGWGSRLEDGRMYQTFFFRTLPKSDVRPVTIEGVDA